MKNPGQRRPGSCPAYRTNLELAGVEDAGNALREHQVAFDLQLAGHERGHAVELALHQRDQVFVFHRDRDICVGGGAFIKSAGAVLDHGRSEEHTSELQSLMRISYAVFCLKQKTSTN